MYQIWSQLLYLLLELQLLGKRKLLHIGRYHLKIRRHVFQVRQTVSLRQNGYAVRWLQGVKVLEQLIYVPSSTRPRLPRVNKYVHSFSIDEIFVGGYQQRRSKWYNALRICKWNQGVLWRNERSLPA
jgi:hypothetical protein